MGKDILYAGGYTRPWTNDEEEIKASRTIGGWHPSSVDFKATADATGGGTEVRNLDDVVNYLKNKPPQSVDQLIIIGHAMDGLFGLGGTIVKPTTTKKTGDVIFTNGSYIDGSALTSNAAKITSVQSAFAPKAKIILVGCDAGMGSTLLNKFATAFNVCVLGFSDSVWTGFTVTNTGNQIHSRGHVFYDTTGLMKPGTSMAPKVDAWTRDATNLITDRKSDNCP